MNDFQLIQVFTKDQLKLNGLYSAGDKTKSACIFIHGFTADFYSHNFYHTIADKLKQKSVAFILAQNRGTGLQTEFLKPDGKSVFIGSYYEKLIEAHLDISAFINFLVDQGYQDIILIGHSLGTIKSVRYLFEGEYKAKIAKLILLAPFDKNAFIETKAPGKWHSFLDIAQQKIQAGQGQTIVPVPEYEDFPISYETFYAWYETSDLNRIWDFYLKDYDFPILHQVNIPVKVILGEKDEFVHYPQLGVTAESALTTIKKHVKNCQTALIAGSGHTFFGFEKEVAEEVSDFV